MNTTMALLTREGLLAVGGLVSGPVTNWHGARRDERRYDYEAEQVARQYEHERRMTHEARHQERIATADEDFLVIMHKASGWAINFPCTVPTRQKRPVTPVTLEDYARVVGLIEAYGSSMVQGGYSAWSATLRNIQLAAVELVKSDREHGKGSTEGDVIWKSITDELLPNEKRVPLKLIAIVAEELGRM